MCSIHVRMRNQVHRGLHLSVRRHGYTLERNRLNVNKSLSEERIQAAVYARNI